MIACMWSCNFCARHGFFLPQFFMCAAACRLLIVAARPLSSFGTGTMPVHIFYNLSNFDIHLSASCSLFFVCCMFGFFTTLRPSLTWFERILRQLIYTNLVQFCYFNINHTNQSVLLSHYFSPITWDHSNEQTYTSNPGPRAFLTTHRRRWHTHRTSPNLEILFSACPVFACCEFLASIMQISSAVCALACLPPVCVCFFEVRVLLFYSRKL